jgi:N-acetylneuraminic acid mutarotase
MGKINKIKRKLKLGYQNLFKYVRRSLAYVFKPTLNLLNRYLSYPINTWITIPLTRKLGIRRTKKFKKVLKYGFSFLAVVAIAVAVVSTVVNKLIANSYHLPVSIQAMIGSADTNLMKSQLSYNSKTKTYYIDKSGIGAKYRPGAPSGDNSITIGSKSNSAFSLVIPTNIHQGFTTYDNTSGLSFTLTPQFDARTGKIVDGHLVYPIGLGSTQDVYTVKANGLQENIVYSSAPKGTVRLSYKLTLPDTLQAKMMSNGDVGIYSAGSYLFGNISYGSSSDQALVASARLKAAKNTLVFVLPAPQVTDNNGLAPAKVQQQTKFSLNGNILTVIASNLSGINGPLSIDPSVIDATASAFQQSGNNESDISFAGSSVSEAGLSGGGLAGNTNSCGTSWCASSTSNNTGFSLPIYTQNATTIVYNGYIYLMGGNVAGSIVPTVDYAAINSNGSLGAPPTCTGSGSVQNTVWCESSTTANTGFSLPLATGWATAAVYNGYVYLMGGSTGGAVPTVDYVALNATGSLGAPPTCAGTQETDWCESSTSANTGFSLPVSTAYGTAVAYNGFIYFMGGSTGTVVPTVDYAALNANGSLAAPGACAGTQQTDWCESSTTANTNFSLPVATEYASATVYNGYIYFIGGENASSTYVSTVDYAPIYNNGSIGPWSTTISLPTTTGQASATVYNGFIYFIGGYTGSIGVPTVYYGGISSVGDPTSWVASSTTANTGFSLPTATYEASAAVYNGFIYFIGGYTATSVPTVDYAVLNSNGSLGAPATCAGTQETDWCESSTTANTNFSLPIGTSLGSAVAYNGFIYFMSGVNSSSVSVPTVDYALLNANGSLGAPATCAGTQETDWCESSTTANTNFSLPTATDAATAVAYNGFIYFIGGYTSAAVPTVDYALLNANGSLGAPATCAGTQETDWCESSTTVNTNFSLPTATYDATAVAYNGFIYFIGGYTSAAAPTVDYAVLNSNGSLGAPATCAGTQETDWCESSTSANTGFSLPTGNYLTAAVAYNGFIYFMGGSTGPTVPTVEYSLINNGGPGTLGTWNSTSSMPSGLDTAISVAYNGYLYVIQGCTGACGGSQIATVMYSAITSSGALAAPGSCSGTLSGAWCTSTSTANGSLPQTGGNNAVEAYNGYLYEIGGYPITGGPTANVYYVAINSNGSLGTWNSTTSLGSATYALASAVYNGYLYEIGGYTTTVDYAQINSNGSLGSWVPTTVLPGTVSNNYGKSFAYNGYVYYVDGYNVIYAQINSNGSLGSWVATTTLPNNAGVATTLAYGGYIYQLGGWGSSRIANVSYAPINSNGSVGAWTSTTPLPAANGYALSVVYNGYIYEIGGCSTAACPTSAVYVASLQSIPRIGFYSQLIDMSGSSTVDPSADALVVNGTQTGNLGIGSLAGPGNGGTSINYQFGSNACPQYNASSLLTTNSVSIGVPYYVTSSSNGCAVPTDTNYGRWVRLTVKLDDSQTATFPDASSNHTTITGLSLYYHPASNARLRGGGTFSSGSSQALDTPP